MEKSSRHFIIIAGEASGDTHAAHLVDSMKSQDSNITFSGLGGPKMEVAGVELYEDLTKLAVVGFIEVVRHYSKFKSLFDLILKKAEEIKPAAVILVDYPGFNLRLAKALKRKGIKVIYYISPQVWAWKESRVKTIKQCVDRMLVLFEFEKEFYEKHNYQVECVGHPFIDSVKSRQSKEEFLSDHNLSPNNLTIGILPGSRQKEIETLLPIMIDAVETLSKKQNNLQFLVFKAASVNLKNTLPDNLNITTVDEKNINEGLNACDYCMVTSGTATLQTAIMNKPMVVAYKTSLLSYLLAKLFIKIPYIAMVNVIAGKRVVPECIQYEATGENIADELIKFITDESKTQSIKEDLLSVKKSLGSAEASSRAATAVLEAA